MNHVPSQVDNHRGLSLRCCRGRPKPALSEVEGCRPETQVGLVAGVTRQSENGINLDSVNACVNMVTPAL